MSYGPWKGGQKIDKYKSQEQTGTKVCGWWFEYMFILVVGWLVVCM